MTRSARRAGARRRRRTRYIGLLLASLMVSGLLLIGVGQAGDHATVLAAIGKQQAEEPPVPRPQPTPSGTVTAAQDAFAAASPATSAPPAPGVAAGPAPVSAVMPNPVKAGTGTMHWQDWVVTDKTSATAGRTVRVALELEGGIDLDPAATSQVIARTLLDPRGWQAEQRVKFVLVDAAAARAGDFDLRIGIASASATKRLCGSVQTKGYTSCYNGRVVINLDRWMLAVPEFDNDLYLYRTYVINHEVGHFFGLGHVECPGKGVTAPIMLTQTLGLDGCVANGLPTIG